MELSEAERTRGLKALGLGALLGLVLWLLAAQRRKPPSPEG